MKNYSTTYKPFKYEKAMEFAESHERIHWIHDEADLSSDIKDWQRNLTPQEKNLVHQILKLFTQSDVSVGGAYIDKLLPLVKNNEIRNMYISFAAREGIHQRAYAALNDTLNLPESDYALFLQYSEMANKIEFIDREGDELALLLVRMIFAEGVGLFGSFSMLLNFQRFGKLKGMGEIVRWSILDENQHVDGHIYVLKEYLAENPFLVTDAFKKEIYNLAREVYALEEKFIDLVYAEGDIEGLKATEVKQYMKYLVDRRLIQIGLKGNFGVTDNPLTWFDEIIGASEHANFFEAKVTDYQKGGMVGDWGDAWKAS